MSRSSLSIFERFSLSIWARLCLDGAPPIFSVASCAYCNGEAEVKLPPRAQPCHCRYWPRLNGASPMPSSPPMCG